MNESRTIEVLRHTPLFSGLSVTDTARLAAVSTELPIKAGEYVFWEGDPSEHFYVVLAGRVKIVKQSSAGREFIIAFFGPGEIFGEAAAFQGRPYPASAQAAVDSRVISIKKRDFISFLAAHPEVALGMITMLSQRLREAQARMKDLAGERVEQRIATVLVLLSGKLGQELPFTRQEIAAMAGTTTETAIRTLAQLKERGIVTSGRGKVIIVDGTRLRLLSEGPPVE